MIKGIFKWYKELLRGKELMTVELAEAREIAELIIKKIEKKIEDLEAIESTVDEKILTLQRLIDKIEILKDFTHPADREREIMNLCQRGLKIDEIAKALDIPHGEVELILNLYHTESLSNSSDHN